MDTARGPVAARMRRPGWRDPRLLAGLALIAVAVAGVVAVLRDADTTAPYYAARTTLAPGTVLEDGDLVVAHVRVGEGYLHAPDGSPVGKVLDRTVAAGELIPASGVVPADRYGARPVAVTVTAPLADAVVPGATVDVWVTPEEGASTLAASGATVSQVVEGAGTFGGGGATVYAVVPAAQVGGLLDALAGATAVTVVGMG